LQSKKWLTDIGFWAQVLGVAPTQLIGLRHLVVLVVHLSLLRQITYSLTQTAT
jgi:hypothetical protein